MKKIILLTAMLIFLSCCAKEPPHAYQWVCLEPSSAFDERKIKPEDAVYISENVDDEYWINFMTEDKIDFKSSPLGWKVYSLCIKVTWKDGRKTPRG